MRVDDERGVVHSGSLLMGCWQRHGPNAWRMQRELVHISARCLSVPVPLARVVLNTSMHNKEKKSFEEWKVCAWLPGPTNCKHARLYRTLCII